MAVTLSASHAAPHRMVSLDGLVGRPPGLLRFALRRVLRSLVSCFRASPPAAENWLRPSRAADRPQVAAYLADVQSIVDAAKRDLARVDDVRAGYILAMAPLALGGAAEIGASEAIAVVLSEGVVRRWRDEGVASRTMGEIVLSVQRAAQNARRSRPSHRVYVLVYESGGPHLVALNLEACRRPAEAVQEARERVLLIDALRRRFSAETVAHAALLGGEPSLILDSALAAEPRRRPLAPEQMQESAPAPAPALAAA